jgi:hypothetical protein
VGGAGVDERLRAGAGQQRGVRAQESAERDVESEGAAVGQRMQEGARGGRGSDPAERKSTPGWMVCRHRAVPRHVRVVDAVRAGDHVGHDAGGLGIGRRMFDRSGQVGRAGRNEAPLWTGDRSKLPSTTGASMCRQSATTVCPIKSPWFDGAWRCC